MSKLAHSNQETMDEIERRARDEEERGVRDEPPTKRCPACLGHGHIPRAPLAHLSVKVPADSTCTMCKGEGTVPQSRDSAMDMIAKLSFQIGYLKVGIEHAARDLRAGNDLNKVLDQLHRLDAEAEERADAQCLRK
jgi:hypothetical protein